MKIGALEAGGTKIKDAKDKVKGGTSNTTKTKPSGLGSRASKVSDSVVEPNDEEEIEDLPF